MGKTRRKLEKGELNLCDNCKKPMGNSWHTETDVGELEIFVHVKCVKEWCDKQIEFLREIELKEEVK